MSHSWLNQVFYSKSLLTQHEYSFASQPLLVDLVHVFFEQTTPNLDEYFFFLSTTTYG